MSEATAALHVAVLPSGPVPGIYKKMLKVMNQVDRVPKNGYNSYHNYHYVTEADLIDHIRPLLVDAGIVVIPTVLAYDKQGEIGRMEVLYRFIDADDGSYVEVKVIGEGQDKNDKAPYKAMTGAGKYAFMKMFHVSTGDDPERDDGQDEQNRQGARRGGRLQRRPSGRGAYGSESGESAPAPSNGHAKSSPVPSDASAGRDEPPPPKQPMSPALERSLREALKNAKCPEVHINAVVQMVAHDSSLAARACNALVKAARSGEPWGNALRSVGVGVPAGGLGAPSGNGTGTPAPGAPAGNLHAMLGAGKQ